MPIPNGKKKQTEREIYFGYRSIQIHNNCQIDCKGDQDQGWLLFTCCYTSAVHETMRNLTQEMAFRCLLINSQWDSLLYSRSYEFPA